MSKARTIPGQRLVGRLLQREALATGVDDRSPLLRRFGRNEEGLPTLSYLSGAAYYQERDQWLARRFSGRASLSFQRREWSSAAWMSWKEGSAGATSWSSDRLPAAVFLNQAEQAPVDEGRGAPAPVRRRFQAAPLPATVLRALEALSESVGPREASRVQDEVLRLAGLPVAEQGSAVRRLVRRLGGVQATVRRRLDRASQTLQVGPDLVPQGGRHHAVARRSPRRSSVPVRSAVRSVPRGRPAAGRPVEATWTSAAVRDVGDQRAAGRAGPSGRAMPVARSPLADDSVQGIEQAAAGETYEPTWLDALEGDLQEAFSPEAVVPTRAVTGGTFADALQAVFAGSGAETERAAAQLERHLSGKQPTRPAERPLLRSWAAQAVRPGVLRDLAPRADDRARSSRPAGQLPTEGAARPSAGPAQTLLAPVGGVATDAPPPAQVPAARSATSRVGSRARVEPTPGASRRAQLALAELSGSEASPSSPPAKSGDVGPPSSRSWPRSESRAGARSRRAAPTAVSRAEARTLPKEPGSSASFSTLRWEWHGAVPVASGASVPGVRQTAPDRAAVLASSGRPVPRRARRSPALDRPLPYEPTTPVETASAEGRVGSPPLLRNVRATAAPAQPSEAAVSASVRRTPRQGGQEAALGGEAASRPNLRTEQEASAEGREPSVDAPAPYRVSRLERGVGPSEPMRRLAAEARPSHLLQPALVTLQQVDAGTAPVAPSATPRAGAARSAVGSSARRPALRQRVEAQASPAQERLESWWVAPHHLRASPQVPRWSALAVPQVLGSDPTREVVATPGSPDKEGGLAARLAPRVRWVAGRGSASSTLVVPQGGAHSQASARTSSLAPTRAPAGPRLDDAGASLNAEAATSGGTAEAWARQASSWALAERPLLKIAARGESGPTPTQARPLLAEVLAAPATEVRENPDGSGRLVPGAVSRRSGGEGASKSVGRPARVGAGAQSVRPEMRFVPASRLRLPMARGEQRPGDVARSTTSARPVRRADAWDRSAQPAGEASEAALGGAVEREASRRLIPTERNVPATSGPSRRLAVEARVGRARRLDAASARERSLMPRAVQVQRLQASEFAPSWFPIAEVPSGSVRGPERAVLLERPVDQVEPAAAPASPRAASRRLSGPPLGRRQQGAAARSAAPDVVGRRQQGAAARSAAPDVVGRRAQDLAGQALPASEDPTLSGWESSRQGLAAAPVRRAMARLVPGFDGDSDLPRPAIAARLAPATESDAGSYASVRSSSAELTPSEASPASFGLGTRAPSAARAATERIAARDTFPQVSLLSRAAAVGRALVADLGAPLPTLLVAPPVAEVAAESGARFQSPLDRGARRVPTRRRAGGWAAATASVELPTPPGGAAGVRLVPSLLAALRDVVPVGVASSAEREGTLSSLPAERTRSPLSAPLLRASASRSADVRRPQAAVRAQAAEAGAPGARLAPEGADAFGWWTGRAVEPELVDQYRSGVGRPGMRPLFGADRSGVGAATGSAGLGATNASGWVQEAGELVWLAPPVDSAAVDPTPAAPNLRRRTPAQNAPQDRRAAVAGGARRVRSAGGWRANAGEALGPPEAGSATGSRPASPVRSAAGQPGGAPPLRWLLSGQSWWSGEAAPAAAPERPVARLRAGGALARDPNVAVASAPNRRRVPEAPAAASARRVAPRPDPVVLPGPPPETEASSGALGLGQLGATFRRGVQAQARGLERALVDGRRDAAAPSLRTLLSGLEAAPSGSANVIRGLLANWAELAPGRPARGTVESPRSVGATVRARLTARMVVAGQDGASASAPGGGAALASVLGGARAPAASLRLDWLSVGRELGELGAPGALSTVLASPEGAASLDAPDTNVRRPVWPRIAAGRRPVGRRGRPATGAVAGEPMPLDNEPRGLEGPALVSAVQREEPWAAARMAEPNVRRLQERGQGPRAGESVRSSEGLVRALARATRPEDVVQLISSQGLSARLLAAELPGAAGRLVQQISEQSAPAESRPTVRTVRQEVLRPVRTFGGSIQGVSGSAQHGRGVGASNVMKLAGKLMKLIHLAESERRLRDAQSQVRMAEDTHDARSEGSAGGVNDAKKADKVDIQALQQEVLEAVLRELELLQARREDPDGRNKWW